MHPWSEVEPPEWPLASALDVDDCLMRNVSMESTSDYSKCAPAREGKVNVLDDCKKRLGDDCFVQDNFEGPQKPMD